MGIQAIKDNIVAQLKTVVGIGKVQDFDRSTNEWETYLKEFFVTLETTAAPFAPGINGWVVVWSSATPEQREDHDARFRVVNTFTIKGYLSLKDIRKTGKNFEILVERVRDKLRNNSAIFTVCPTLSEPTTQLLEIGHIPFGQVLCHFCTLTLPVEEEITLP